MAKTKLSDMGGIVCVDGRENELIYSAISDGTAKPGHLIQLIAIGAGVATANEILLHDHDGGDDRMMGILLPKYNTDCDSVIVDRDICEYVIPSSGHRYNIACNDVGAGALAGTVGTPCISGADGEIAIGTLTLEVSIFWAMVSKEVVDDDRYAEVIWVA